VKKTALSPPRFSDIMISENRWQSVEDQRCLILDSTESSCDSLTRSWVRSSKRCSATIPSRAAGLRFRSGSETSWSLMRAKSSKSRSRDQQYATSPAVPRTGNDGDSRGPSVGPREGDANEPRSRRRLRKHESPRRTNEAIFSLALLWLTFRSLPSVVSGRQVQGNVLDQKVRQTVTYVPGLNCYRCRRPDDGITVILFKV
jgi:hypothetical protein